MRILLVLFELLIPFTFVFIFYFIYKNIISISNYKNDEKWDNYINKNRENRHSIEFSQYLPDLQQFLFSLAKKIPLNSYENLKKNVENIESLQAKSQVEDFNSKNRPQQINLIADILYKHIPDTVNEFVQLPKSLANLKNEQGKSPIDLINMNTFILSKSCNEITLSLFENNLQKMKIQQYYLKNKFSQETKEMEE